MAGDMARVNFPGYSPERLPSGAIRHRVRVKDSPKVKITLPCGPDNPDFQTAYLAARAGIKPDKTRVEVAPRSGTVGWLVNAYMAHLARMVDSGQASHLTLKQRRGMAQRLLDRRSTSGGSKGKEYRGLPMVIPAAELMAMRDDMMATPGAAKNTFKFLRAMYAWAVDRGHCSVNPAAAIKVEYTSAGGAVPWSIDDFAKFRKAHPQGTMAHLTLTLFVFTACRIEDAIALGRRHETRNGSWLAWTPGKRGSRPVDIPILPPLAEAIRSQKIVGDTYLLTEAGKPFASPEALRNRLRKWCATAGLENRTSHGIRKAAGHLLALHGATQYEIMSVHGHANAATSQIYTRDVERTQLAERAVARLSGVEW
ncbi:site-specific integrase [Roseovarius sp. SK2]|uniref:tyrosine-type recombinase/integrase n=1 Tax=Roseovarius TaxID=74030 RepID=UPI00237AB447|nr:site-specific integrase [Roseovarius sp. SK2]MDD9727188.1 site-specific integrase [Roseovarius sp. SK2]